MGVYRRGKIWYIRYRGPDGRDRRESTEQESKRVAEKIPAKRRTEIAEGKFLDRVEQPKMTFPQLCDWYWSHHGRQLRWNGVAGVLKRFRRFFGSRTIAAVTPELVSEYADRRRSVDNVKPRTVNRDLQLLKSMFYLIIRYKRWARVLENPVAYVKLAKETNLRARYLDGGEIRSLIEACDDHLRPIVILAVRTGMRRGEIFSLRWSDVDPTRRQIFIRRSKNGESRFVPISDDLLETLVRLPSRGEDGYVFPSPLPRRGSPSRNGGRSRGRTAKAKRDEPLVDIKNSWKAAVKKAGIKDFRFHDLRHTFASHLVMQGVDLNTVRELLGHKSLQMTLRYAHLSPGHNRDAIQRIDSALGPIEERSAGTPTGTAKILVFKTVG